MIDCHCHILPGLDDGPESLEEMAAMASLAVADGITAAIATPHTNNNRYHNPPARVTELVDIAQQYLDEQNIPLRLYPGAEIHLEQSVASLIREGEVGTLNHGSRYVLIELPIYDVPFGLQDELFLLARQGLTPIIAHPERNMRLQKDMDLLEALVTQGALCQLTAGSITGAFGPRVQNSAERMVQRRLAHFIASDAHTTRTRIPALAQAVTVVARILDNHQEAQDMVTTNPQAILDNTHISAPEPLTTHSRSWLRRLFRR